MPPTDGTTTPTQTASADYITGALSTKDLAIIRGYVKTEKINLMGYLQADNVSAQCGRSYTIRREQQQRE
jgi:hypothetical protein